jgi:ribosomal protein S18 acetylase RimI-like enzyme
LINIASDGVVEFLFHDLVANMTSVQVVAHNLAEDHYPHSYKSALVAVDGKKVVGMALSFPSAYHKITDEMREFFPNERLEHLNDFYAVDIPDSWFLDALAVDPVYRRQGIGLQLIKLTQERAINKGYKMISLIAFKDNLPALALYEGLGFRVIADVNLAGNAFIPHAGGCSLLTCPISA